MAYYDQLNENTREANRFARELPLKNREFTDAERAAALAQSNWETSNREKQDQQGFENQGVLRTRNLEDQAREAANTGDLNAIKYLQSMDQENNGPEGTMTGPNGAPMRLRAGETPITSGISSGVSPAGAASQSGAGQPQMTLERLAKSVVKQNPDLANNPTAFFAALDRLKPMLVGSDQQRLEQLKFQQQKELQSQKDTAAMERVKARPASGGAAGIEGEIIKQSMLPVEQGGQGLSFEDAVEKAKAYKRAQSSEVTANTTAKKEAELGVKREGEAPKARNMMEDTLVGVDNALNFIDQAKGKASPWNTGMGSVLNNVPGSSAKDMSAAIDTIKSNIGFDKLQQMKADSPTGSALGRVTNQEITMLTNVVANLSNSQSQEQFVQHLDIAKKALQDSKQRIRQAYEDTYGNVKGGGDRSSQSGGSQPPMQGARQARDGNWYVPDPSRPGKYLQVQQ